MEDERQVEMDCLAAIFPEMVVDARDRFSASIELPVNPNTPVKVVFPASAEGSTPALPSPPLSESSGDGGAETTFAGQPAQNLESHNLSYLPALQLHITLPEGYPEKCAPVFKLSTFPAWLSRQYLDKLQDNGTSMWEEGGHTEVVYGYIDSLQQAAENAFGHSDGEALVVPDEFKIALLDYDIKATQAAFDKETFECGVCLGKAVNTKIQGLPNILQIRKRAPRATACSTAAMCSACSACMTSTTMRLPKAIWSRCDV